MSDDTKALIGAMVDRFLCWKLPEDFDPDCGISFARFHRHGTTRFEPIGTNLLSAEQARMMLEHVIGDTIERIERDRDALEERCEKLREALRSCSLDWFTADTIRCRVCERISDRYASNDERHAEGCLAA